MKTKSKKISWMTRLAYGGGDAACNIVMGMISTILTLFYTDYAGINPASVGIIMLVSRFLDGAATLGMGFVAERTQTKYGKYRPWLLWTALPYALSIILLFTIPQPAKLAYVFITYNLCTTVMYNAMNVPYGSLAYVMTRESGEREKLSTVRMIMASAARLLTVCGTLPLVKLWGDGQNAWVQAAAIWAISAVILQLFCFKECRETETVSREEKVPFITAMKAVLENKYFWVGACIQTMQYVLFAVTGTGLIYYCKYIFKNESELYSILYFAEISVLIFAMLLSPVFIRKWGKKNVCICGVLLTLAGHLVCMSWPQNLACVTASCIVRAIALHH